MLMTLGLGGPVVKKTDKENVLTAIKKIGALQIDTINVVARSPYLVIWSRIGSYETLWLDELLTEGKIFEGWAHAACYLPIEDFSIYRSLILQGRRNSDYKTEWVKKNKKTMDLVLNYVRSKG